MQRSTICFLVKRYPRLSETFIINEVRALERLGVRVHIVSLLEPGDDHAQPSIRDVRAEVTYLPKVLSTRFRQIWRAHMQVAIASPVGYLRAALLTIRWAVVRGRPALATKAFMRAGFVTAVVRCHHLSRIHAHFANAPAAVGRLVAIMAGVPFSFTAHAKDLYLTGKRAIRKHVDAADLVMTCTRYNLRYLREIVPAKDHPKLHCLYHGIDLSPFASPAAAEGTRRDPASNALPPLLLSVGRLVAKKGMADLIDVCDDLRARHVRFQCIIVGDGPLRSELIARVNKLTLADQVTLLGALAPDRLIELYHAAAVFVLAPAIVEDGDRDGIPNVLVEAMAARVPVVSTAVSGIPELIENTRTGLLVGPHDRGALADAIVETLGDRIAAQKRADEARRFVRERFDVWRNTRILAALLTASQSHKPPCSY